MTTECSVLNGTAIPASNPRLRNHLRRGGKNGRMWKSTVKCCLLTGHGHRTHKLTAAVEAYTDLHKVKPAKPVSTPPDSTNWTPWITMGVGVWT